MVIQRESQDALKDHVKLVSFSTDFWWNEEMFVTSKPDQVMVGWVCLRLLPIGIFAT